MSDGNGVRHPDLAGKVALVTGAGRGIGRSLALATAAAGVRVAGCALEEAELDEVARLIETSSYSKGFDSEAGPDGRRGSDSRSVHGGHLFRACDTTDEAGMSKFVADVVDQLGPIDILIANAGVTDRDHHRLVDLPTNVWEHVVRVNLTGTFITLKTVLPQMVSRAQGNIIVITSLLGQKGYGQANDGPYCASKFGVEGLVEVAVAEYSSFGININTLFPAAMVDTGFFAHISARERQQLSHADVLDEAALFLAGLAPGALTGESMNGKRWREEPGYRAKFLARAAGC